MAKRTGWQFVVLAFGPIVLIGAQALAPEASLQMAGSLRSTPALQSDGADIFAENCVSCHGKGGKGDGPAAAALNPKPPDLTDAELMGSMSDAQLLKVLSDGKGFMPGYASMLSTEELQALTAYVRSLSAKDAGRARG
jgi:mono/diheme cytochrome c family protein